MILSVRDIKTGRYKIFDKEGNQLGRIQEFDTDTCVAKRVATEAGKAIISANGLEITEIVTLYGAYAVTPTGKRI